MSEGPPPPPPPPPPYPPYQGPGGEPGWSGGFIPDQRQATTALVLGILGLVVCGVIAPFAWVIGRSSLREIDSSGGTLGGRSKAQVGYILGIIGSVLLILTIVIGVLLLIVGVASSSSSGSGAGF